MTIIILQRNPDCFYLGADSQWTDADGLKTYKSKLREISTPTGNTIAWGTAGNPEIGITEFGKWIADYKWTGNESWTEFIVEASAEFARLNAIRKAIGQAAAEVISSREFITTNLCDLLICGQIANHMCGYEVDHNGTYQSTTTLGGFIAIGTGSPFARAVYATQMWYEAELKLDSGKQFNTLMGLTARYGSQCSLPVEYLKIVPGGIEPFISNEPNIEAERLPSATQSG